MIKSMVCMLALGASVASNYGWGVLGRVRCPAEALPVPGVVISVSGSTALGPYSATGTTDVDGNYFIDLPDSPGSWTATLDVNTIPYGSTVTTANPAPFQTTANNGLVRVDFRLANCSVPPPTGCIGNFVWQDLNGNGQQEAGEPGISGATVTLVDSNGNVVATTSTDANGFYLFENLTLGTYTVEVETPAGLNPTTANAPGVASDVDSDASGVQVTIGLNNLCDYTIDFGFVTPPPPPTGCIGNFVWNDLNSNGRQDAGEPGIAGVTVTLLDASSVVVATTTTDASGFYIFEDLTLGEYIVQVTTPAGVNPTTSNAPGVPADLDSNASGVHVVITENALCDYTIDFGFVTPPPPSNPGTGTPGYWKNHPEAWPVDQITVGGVVYTKAAAIEIMKTGNGKDKTTTMFMHLVSAMLNVMIGNEDSCIANEIADANAWLAVYPVGSNLPAKSPAWKIGDPLKNELDAYNNGLLCAPHRD